MSFYEWFFLEKDRTPEGYFSWQHLLSVTVALAIFLGLAVLLSNFFKGDKKKINITFIAAAILIVGVQILKIVNLCIGSPNIWDTIVGNAPLYLCDMAIFVIPLCAITRGRFRNCCFDFMAIWGFIMAFFGTYFAGNIYGVHCAISYAAIISLINHSISGFVGLFIWMNKLNTMEKRNIPISVSLLVAVMTFALIMDYADNHNFMFFKHGDGTPFDFFKNLVGGNLVLYDIEVYILQCGYMVGFYFAYYGILKLIDKVKAKKLDAQIENAETGEEQK